MAVAAKLKIGLVLDTSLDPNDGVQQYVINLGSWLSSQGHEVHYLVGESKRTDIPNLHSLAKNIHVKFNGNETTVPFYASRKEIKTFLNEHKFDVLHIQTPHHPFLAQRIVLAADPKTAIIGTFHILPYGPISSLLNRGLGLWLRPSLRRFDKMLAVSNVAANFCRSSYGIGADVVPNMVDFDHFNKARAIVKENKPIIVFLGRLVERKGCLDLLKAISLLKDDGQFNFKVLILGEGPMRKKLQNYVLDKGLEKIVDFKGYVEEEDKPGYLASADIAVFPASSGESFGIVLLEALAGGKSAVLAGDNPGYRSVMEVNDDLLFDPEDPHALAEKLKLFLLNPNKRGAAREWGEKYAKNFDKTKVCEKIYKVYVDTLDKKRDDLR